MSCLAFSLYPRFRIIFLLYASESYSGTPMLSVQWGEGTGTAHLSRNSSITVMDWIGNTAWSAHAPGRPNLLGNEGITIRRARMMGMRTMQKDAKDT